MNRIRYSKILIVDDNGLQRAFLKKTLKDGKIGHIYYEARDGKEAISQYIAKKPDLVIMDIVMPNVDGIKATQAITKYDPNAKIIMVSENQNKGFIDRSVNQGGAKDYVFKSHNVSQLIKIISKHLM